jgi:general secretion pathway protein A
MYEAYYGLRERPFSLLPDPGFLYLSAKHKMAMSLLEYGVESQTSFTVVTGGIGTGKTTLVRQLLNELGEDVTVGLISNTHHSFGELLQWVSLAFNLDSAGKDKVELYRQFTDFLIDQYASNRRTVLIIDEAQNLSAEALEELRMLSNINSDKDQLLQIFLVGQAGLRETLTQPELEQFAQRIAVDYHLDSLDPAETGEYVRHRLRIAGGNPELFSPSACEAIHRYSGGIPRLINLLCDTVLVYGYAEQRQSIHAELVDDVARDKQRGGLFPIGGRRNKARSFVQPTETPPADDDRRRLRAVVVTNGGTQGNYLKAALGNCGVEIVRELTLADRALNPAELGDADIVFVDLVDDADQDLGNLDAILQNCPLPVLFNDSSDSRESLADSPSEYRKRLSLKLTSLLQR